MTDNEKKVLEAIVDYIKKYQYPPTVRNLCALTGINSTSTVHAKIKSLAEKGYIEFDNCARGIRVRKECVV